MNSYELFLKGVSRRFTVISWSEDPAWRSEWTGDVFGGEDVAADEAWLELVERREGEGWDGNDMPDDLRFQVWDHTVPVSECDYCEEHVAWLREMGLTVVPCTCPADAGVEARI
jgi:hypothetical protein